MNQIKEVKPEFSWNEARDLIRKQYQTGKMDGVDADKMLVFLTEMEHELEDAE